MWRSAVQLRAGLRYGGIAQLVEHLLCKQRVKSSNLFISTKKKHLQKCRCFFCFYAHPLTSSTPRLLTGPSANSLWQGGRRRAHSNSLHLGREMPFYTLLWHIGCQSEIDELVSMASRPVYRGFCRMAETKVPFHPVKSGFGRMGRVSTQFRPPKRLFRRMGNIVSREQLQKIPTKAL